MVKFLNGRLHTDSIIIYIINIGKEYNNYNNLKIARENICVFSIAKLKLKLTPIYKQKGLGLPNPFCFIE
jgi:hypothetical protein